MLYSYFFNIEILFFLLMYITSRLNLLSSIRPTLIFFGVLNFPYLHENFSYLHLNFSYLHLNFSYLQPSLNFPYLQK